MITHQLSAEWLKARSGRPLAVIAGIGIAIVALSAVGAAIGAARDLASGSTSAAELTHHLIRNSFALLLFSGLFGAVLVTGEFRAGVVGRSLLIRPQRDVLVAAKTATAAAVGLGLGVVAAGIGLATAWFALRGAAVFDGGTWLICAGLVAVNAFSACLGAALGWLIRNQALAVVTLLIWMLIVEPALIRVAPGAGRFLPGNAMNALYGDPDPELLTPLIGALVLISWTMLFLAAAHRSATVRDPA